MVSLDKIDLDETKKKVAEHVKDKIKEYRNQECEIREVFHHKDEETIGVIVGGSDIPKEWMRSDTSFYVFGVYNEPGVECKIDKLPEDLIVYE